jgi:hypothetical protein
MRLAARPYPQACARGDALDYSTMLEHRRQMIELVDIEARRRGAMTIDIERGAASIAVTVT